MNNSVVIYSSRNYTVPDPPGLFDGHVWPMYVKHRKIMEDLGVDVGKSLMTKALPKDCFMRVLFKPGIYILVKCMRGVEAGGWSIFL